MDLGSIMPNELAYFATAYRCGTLAEAASSIPMTVPGVKKALRKLERDLGFTLFESLFSADGKLVSTPCANELYEMVQKWYVDLEKLGDALDGLRLDGRTTISLGSALGVPGFLGVDFAQCFERDHSRVALQLTELTDYRVDAGLFNREFRVALTSAPFCDEFETRVIHEEPISVWINRAHPLSGRNEICAADLDGQAIGIVDRTCKINSLVLNAIEQAGARPASIVTSTELFWLLEFAREGKGLGFGIPHVSSVLEPGESVVSVPVHDICWCVGVSHLKGQGLSADELALSDYLACLATMRRRRFGLE